jgi:pantoate kinase
MTLPVRTYVEIWVPHRISGFFQIQDPDDKRNISAYEQIGSRGGGPALDAYGKTQIRILGFFAKTKASKYHIFLNNEDKSTEAVTTLSVLRQMESKFPDSYEIEIKHTFDLPPGCGYGSSGTGAIGTAIGMNMLLNLGLSLLELGRIAHNAEVINHTGLGTVGGQIYGGLSISMEPGFPFQMDFIPYPENLRIVTASWGPLSTKSILTHPEYKRRIMNAGAKAMEKIRHRFDFHNYIRICNEFINETELAEKLSLTILIEAVNSINQLNVYGTSMNQLGNSLFCFCDESQTELVLNELKKFNPTSCLKILSLCPHGPIIKKLE